jgi:hypothetical protein
MEHTMQQPDYDEDIPSSIAEWEDLLSAAADDRLCETHLVSELLSEMPGSPVDVSYRQAIDRDGMVRDGLCADTLVMVMLQGTADQRCDAAMALHELLKRRLLADTTDARDAWGVAALARKMREQRNADDMVAYGEELAWRAAA